MNVQEVKKRIAGRSDLAIHGAAPAFDEPLHVGRPNIGSRETFDRYISQMFERRWFSNNGPLVQQFEQEVARFLGVKHCVAMCNGTIALEIAIRALDLAGEVIVPAYTFVATAHALQWQGLTPVFADIDPATHNLDPDSVRKMITPRTTGIIGVHLWGRPAEHSELQKVAEEHGLALMYDAAHAFGCSDGETMIGNFGSCEVLSFHATKFFNTFEGGAVVTNDDLLADKMRLMRNFGFAGFDNVIYPGTNGKMIEPCAAMGLTNLASIDSVIAANQKAHQMYREGIAGIEGLTILPYDARNRNNFQYVVLEVGESFPVTRDAIVSTLHAENILARKYFWPGVHRMQPYRALYPHARLLLPNTEMIANRVVVLPTGTALPHDAVPAIVAILEVLASEGTR